MLHVLEHNFGLLHPTCPSVDAQVPCALITFSLPRKPDTDGHFLNLQAVPHILFWGAGEQKFVKISFMASSQYVSALCCRLISLLAAVLVRTRQRQVAPFIKGSYAINANGC